MSGKDVVSKVIKSFGIPRLLIILAAGGILVYLSVSDMTGNGGNDVIKNNNLNKETESGQETEDIEDDYNKKYGDMMKAEVENVLSKVQGVGRLKVMLTMESTSEKIVLRDNPYQTENSTDTDSTGATRSTESYRSEQKTVCITKGGDSTPYIVKELEPKIKGVVVVAEGGDDINIKKEIMEAIQVLFGIEPHKIKVMKLE